MMQTDRINADSTTLMRQAPMTANEYFDAAVAAIDGRFGKGYAQANPQLIGAHMQTSALDFGASVIARAIETLADSNSPGQTYV